MKIYDQQGKPVVNFDPHQGRLTMQTQTIHHDAVEAVAEQGHWETVAEYPETGGKDVRWVVDVPGVQGQEAWEESETYWLYIPYTEEELAQMEESLKIPSPEERIKELEEALELLLSGATEIAEVTEDEAGTAKQNSGI